MVPIEEKVTRTEERLETLATKSGLELRIDTHADLVEVGARLTQTLRWEARWLGGSSPGRHTGVAEVRSRYVQRLFLRLVIVIAGRRDRSDISTGRRVRPPAIVRRLCMRLIRLYVLRGWSGSIGQGAIAEYEQPQLQTVYDSECKARYAKNCWTTDSTQTMHQR